MADKHTQRAIASERQRHFDAARAAAERLAEYASIILRDIEKGRPWSNRCVNSATELEKRLAALDAIDGITGIYEAEEADREKPAG